MLWIMCLTYKCIVHLFIYLFLCVFCLPFYMHCSDYPIIYHTIYQSTYLPITQVNLSIQLSFHLSIYLSIYPSILQSIHPYNKYLPIQCVPQKRKPVLSVRYLLCHARLKQTICSIMKSMFSSFIWYQTYNDTSMHEWKRTLQTHACQKRFAQNNGLSWYDQVQTR